jgi:hypothetical protein
MGQVDCQSMRSYFFGTVGGSNLTFSQVKAAQLTSQTMSNEDGDYEVYSVTLLSPQKTANVTRFDYDHATKQDWVNQINQFIASNQTELKLISDTRWNFETFAMMLFASLFVLIGTSVLHGSLRTRTLILDKVLNRLSYKVQTLTGSKQFDYPLGIVTSVELKEHTDSYGNKFYEPVLLPDAVRSITFARTNRQTALQLQEQISQFLKLPVTTPDLSNAEPTVYQFRRYTYTTTGLEALPETVSTKTKESDAKLRQLGFTFVGELQPSNFPGATLYTYVQTYKDVYAIILEAELGYFYVEFFTSFLNGALLSTTSNRLVFKHLKRQKLLRWSYPELDVIQLYQQHQQHFAELRAEAGSIHRAKADLNTIAAVIDDYFMRQVSGGFAVLATILNLLTMHRSNKKLAA